MDIFKTTEQIESSLWLEDDYYTFEDIEVPADVFGVKILCNSYTRSKEADFMNWKTMQVYRLKALNL